MSSGGHGGRRRGKKHEEEEHENHERWMVSYADMLTLLFVLFVVLFAMSQVDKEKFAALAQGLSASLGGPITAQPGATPEGSVLDGLPGAIDIASAIAPDQTVQQAEVDAAAAQAALAEAQQVAAEAQAEYQGLSEVQERIEAALAAAGHAGAARFEIDERGLVVHIVADQVLFDAEQAVLRPEGRQILDAIAPTLRDVPNDLGVEGHANHLPVTPGGPWPSNWELSAYRATTVVRYLTGDGVPGARMVANGYSDTRPLVPPSDPNSITVNRRVDVVVLSDASAEAKELLPGLDAGTTDAGTTDAGTPQEDTHG
jgi:chemotaxis protein MotB